MSRLGRANPVQAIAVAANLAAVYVATYNDSGTGTITLTGSRTESHTHTNTATGTLTFTGTRTESASFADARTGTLTLTGTRTETASSADARTGTITLSGSGVEDYAPPGGAPVTTYPAGHVREILNLHSRF